MNKSFILTGHALNVLRGLPNATVQTCVTSPPYWGLRDYGVAGQLGLEATPELYVARLVEVFREVRRVLKDDGTLWLNLGDSYATGAGKVGDCPGGGKQGARYRGDHGPDPKSAGIGPRTQPNRMPLPGLKPKDLVGIPWMVAFALRADGWYLRSDIIWHKPNPMPESVTDRPTKAHEYLFLLSKSERYFYDADAVAEPAISDHDSGNVARKLADGSDSRLNTHLGRSIPWRLDREGPNSRMHVSRDANHPREFNGKTRKTDPQAAQRRMLLNVKRARDNGASHDSPFGTTRNRRTVWTVATAPFKGAHFATFPPKLIEPCILAGSRPGDVVLDPFAGAFTTALVAQQHGRDFVMIELKPAYVKMGRARLAAKPTARKAAAA